MVVTGMVMFVMNESDGVMDHLVEWRDERRIVPVCHWMHLRQRETSIQNMEGRVIFCPGCINKDDGVLL